jgi:hypothetical protein
MEYVAYSVSISVSFSEAFNLRRGRLNTKEEIEEEVYSRYFDVLTQLNLRLPQFRLKEIAIG